MNKTTNNWNHPTNYAYGNKSIYDNNRVLKKNRKHFNNICEYQMTKYEEGKKLPKIFLKNEVKFSSSPVSDKKDEYIRYILNNKRKQKANNCAVYGKDYSDISVGSARKVRIKAQKMNIDGISFEVHSKCNISPDNSLDYLQSDIKKEMNLMCYDFNGAGKRMGSDSPQPKNKQQSFIGIRKSSSKVQPNRTTLKFFPNKNNDARSTLQDNSKNNQRNISNKQMTEEDKQLSSSEDSESEDSIEIENNKDSNDAKQRSTLDSFSNKSI